MLVKMAAGDAADAGDRAIDRFMARVVADPESHALLGACVTPDAYVAAASDLASQYGIALTGDDITDRLRSGSLGMKRRGRAPVTLDRWPDQGWLPMRSCCDGGDLAFDWAWFGGTPLSDPFFEDSVRRASFLPFNRMFRTRTTLATLIAGAVGQRVIEPSGFIFHMSRCGSTLLSRMLMAAPGHNVVSEAEPIDAVVQWDAPRERRIVALRAIIAALGRARTPGQRHFFIKLDAWHTLDLPLFRAAFPDAPWLFLYRDPVEVMMSHMERPGIHAVSGIFSARLSGIENGATLPPVDYCARALARICAAVLEHWPLGGGMLVDYRDISAAMQDAIPRQFGWRPSPAENAAMKAAAMGHSKYPERDFAPDAKRKRQAAPDDIRIAAATWLEPVHARLDQLRSRLSRTG